jgi:hypothetical protein
MESAMAANLASIKLSADLVDQARREAPVFSRSISGQVEHWARLGQALEAAPGFTLDRVRAALEGRLEAADLTEDEWRIFDDLQFQSVIEPTEAARSAYAELGRRPGAVGTDENDLLVRARADGTLDVIEP